MQNKSLKEDLIEWRREQVLTLTSQGCKMTDIASKLKVDVSTISRDLAFLRVQAKENIKQYLNERLPMEYEKCLTGLTSILEEAWNTSKKTEDNREKIQALSLAKECYGMKLDLLTNVSVVDDVIKFVESKQPDQNSVPTSSNQTSIYNTISDNNGPDTANYKHSHKKTDENIHAKSNVQQVNNKTKSSHFSQGINNHDVQGTTEEINTRESKTVNRTF